MTLNAKLISQLKDLHEIGIALSGQKNLGHLLEKILEAAKRIVNADAGTIYLLDATQCALRFEIVRTDTLNIAIGGERGTPMDFGLVPLYDAAGLPNHAMVVSHAVLSRQTVNIEDAYVSDEFDFSGTRAFDIKNDYRSRSFLTVPMMNHEQDVIGVLQLINAQDEASGLIVSFSADDQQLVESLASQAAIALTNFRLVKQNEELFESFIYLINKAIDDKSPYTAGHCERVPVLTMMLAEAVSRTTQGPLSSFVMSDADRHELKMAGLLHDCGKITTPVHVVDKPTKLHTLFDRIELLDTRFEILRRDAEINMLKVQLASGGGDQVERRAQYQAYLQQLHCDQEFLRCCNQGVEKMSQADRLRVVQIAQYSWCDSEGRRRAFLSADEVENLNIPFGTLTASERGIINRHVELSIKMLEALPWPKYLKNVPEYVGGHHERMDGKGYPRGLMGNQMPLQARILAIADIFEALTAIDRPYKEGKSLTESITILAKMKLGGHIDPDVFDVFIREKIYLEYCQKFFPELSIEDIDLSHIPGISLYQ